MRVEKTVSARISADLYKAILDKCKDCDVSVSLVIKHALRAWVSSHVTLPTFTLLNPITQEGKTLMTKAGAKKKEPVYTNTVCGQWEKIKPIGELKPMEGIEVIETTDERYVDEAGNVFNHLMECVNPDTGDFCTFGKPKWWKEKRID